MTTTVVPSGRGPAAAAGLVGAAAAVIGSVHGTLPVLIAVAVAAPGAAFIWVRPQRGLLVLAALLPFDGLLLVLELPLGVVAWKEVVVGLTLVAAWSRPGPNEVHAPAWLLPAAGLAGIALVSSAFVSPLQAGIGLKVMFFGMATAAVVWRAPLSARERDLLVTVLATVGAITAAVGIAQQVLGPERLNELGYAYNSTIRFTGDLMRSWSTFNHPFAYAFFLMLVVLVCGSVALADPWRNRNLWILVAMPLYVTGLAVAVVRASWVALLAGVIYLAVVRYRRLILLAPPLAALVALGLLAGAAGFFTSNSVDERNERWQQLPALTTDAPLGQGIGSAGAAAARVEALSGGAPTYDPNRVRTTRVVFQPDNTYAKILYELGVAGLALFVALLAAVLHSSRRAEEDPELGPLAGGVSAFVVAAAVASLASTFFEIFPLDYLFWMLVAIVTIQRGLSAAPRPDTSGAPA